MSSFFERDGSHEDLLAASPEAKEPPARLPRRRLTPASILPWFILGFLLVLSLWLIALTREHSNQQCARRLSTPSPALEAVEYHSTLFNGSLTYPSEYRGVPTSEIDAAWDRISTVVAFPITEDELSNTGKPARPSLAKFVDGKGYAAELEVVHQLHCLNMLRKFTYPEYYPRGEDDPDLYRHHIDHCIEMLRQQIMCAGDVGLITFDWVEGHSAPYPDFNVWHQCRDFGKIQAWHEERADGTPVGLAGPTDRLKEAP
ncbi:hypothetical protein IEO21_02048 [Rhodonia placenta]|uniref:Tat pathway signal sequence n=1 Tax=Rhodonia placenta TaxID=104341 RepID=A0A8H7P8U5_9APHY|nr:hypothetical protein IEO21_02048 [Postia placenta]